MSKEEIIWVTIGILCCFGIGLFIAFSLQYFYYKSLALIHWDIIFKGSFLLGCIFIVLMFAFIYTESKINEGVV